MENEIQIFLQLILAAFLGALLGVEREYKRKEAGLRTYTLVSLASAFFVICSIGSPNLFPNSVVAVDPSRIIGQIVVGIGFLGAGLIIYRQLHIDGLTTAAGLWLSAGIGVAVGVQMYWPAVFATLIGIAVLAGLRPVESKIFGTKPQQEETK